MRSYKQYCALARGLDVIGDRWTLLIVRELLLAGPLRYTDLRDGLPGIATNLLVDRLRDLEQVGVIERIDAPRPVATTLFRLTAWGEGLRPVVLAIGQWAAPLLRQTDPGEAFQSHWLPLPAELFLTDRAPDQPPITIAVHTGDEPLVIETVDGTARMRPLAAGPAVADADAVIEGPPQLVLGLLSGNLPLADAQALGLTYTGDAATLDRVLAAASPADL